MYLAVHQFDMLLENVGEFRRLVFCLLRNQDVLKKVIGDFTLSFNWASLFFFYPNIETCFFRKRLSNIKANHTGIYVREVLFLHMHANFDKNLLKM